MDLSQSTLFSSDGEKPPLHFSSANGFPVGVYQPLLKLLGEQYNVAALANRATWQPAVSLHKSRDWDIYANDLITFIEQQNVGPVVGVGHSLGATCTILAATKRPDLFSKLVLIEPAMVTKPLALLVKMLPKRIMNKINPAKGTLNKPEQFATRDEFLSHIKKFKGYSQFSAEMFELFANHSVVPNQQNGFSLAFPKHWEAHNYTQPPNVMPQLANLAMPVVAIRAKPGIFFSEKLWRQWKNAQPTAKFLESLDHGHLLPLEDPALCSDLIIDGLA